MPSLPILALCFVTGLVLCAQAPLPSVLQNPGFEDGVPGESPKGWIVPRQGVKAELRAEGALEGKQCAVLTLASEHSESAMPFCMQNIDAAPYRGKRIRFKAFLRIEASTEGRSGEGAIWLTVSRPEKTFGLSENTQARPIKSRSWTGIEIVGDVEEDAQVISLGALLQKGDGKLWVDAVSLEALGKPPIVRMEAAKPLSRIGLSNLVAFTKALGYVRFFCPSDEAAGVDWDRVAKAGVKSLEGALTRKDLARCLQSFFGPYVPSIRFTLADKPALPVARPAMATQVVRWQHHGAGFTRQNGYESNREYADLVAMPADWPKPEKVESRDLGRGLKIQFSTTLYSDRDHHTLPCGAKPKLLLGPKIPAMPAPTKVAATPLDRATRLAAVVQTWNVIQHFYPNFDLINVDWPGALETALRQVAADGTSEGYLRTVKAMMASLKDGHGTVTPTWTMAEGRPGVELTWVGDDLVICGLEEGLQAQLNVGDVLVSIDGVAAGQVAENLASTTPSSTIQGLRYLEAQMLLQGPPKVLDLVVQGADGGSRRVQISRAAWQTAPTEPRPTEPVAELRAGILYVDLGRLTRGTVPDLIVRAAAVNTIILDMRGYPPDIAAWKELFSHFAPFPLETPVFQTPTPALPDRLGMTFSKSSWAIKPMAPLLQAKLVFLADARALSQAELLLDFVEFYKLGEIVGEATAGTDGNINPFESGGLWVRWTGMKVLKHDGSPLNGVGIVPTVPVKRTLAGIREGRDEMLEKALGLASH